MAKRSSENIKSLPVLKDFGPSFESIAFLSVSRTIICIDDLERKGKHLDLKDVLGLATVLKENKDCKIIFLLNDGERGLEEYVKHRDKVVDIEYRFDPTPMECAQIAFDENIEEVEYLCSESVKLEIKNIRILKKIQRYVTQAFELIPDSSRGVKKQIISSLVLYVWCTYYSASDDTIPDLDSVIDVEGLSLSLYDHLTEDKDLLERNQSWYERLAKYGYTRTDNLDKALAEGVKKGYFQEEGFIQAATVAAKELNDLNSDRDCYAKYMSAWQLFHDSLDDNTDEVVSELYKAFIVSMQIMDQEKLNSVVVLFRDLGEDIKADELIDSFISKRGGERDLFHPESRLQGIRAQDKELLRKFTAHYESVVPVDDIETVLLRVIDGKGWSEVDSKIFLNTSVEQYEELFKKAKNGNLTKYIKNCMKIEKAGGKEILNSRIALEKISKESPINERRLRNYLN